MTYESFISGLKNLQGDKNELKRLEEKKEVLEYLETGVKAINAEKVHVSGNPSVIAEIRLDKIDELFQLEYEINLIKENIKHIMRVYEAQSKDIKEILNAIYIKGGKKVDVAKKYLFKSDVEMERYLKRGYIS